MKYALILLAAAPFFALEVRSQTPAPATPTTPVAPAPSTRTTVRSPTTTTATPNADTLNLPPRPIFLSGKVIMEDGTPPPDSVKLEKICNGNPRPQGYTDSKGRFNIQLDSGMGVMADASDSSFTRPGSQPNSDNGFGGSTGTFTRNSLSGCDIRAILPGFRSDLVNLSFHDSLDNPNIGSIVLHRMGNVEGTTISMTSLQAPKEALKAFQKGREAEKKQKADEAEKHFRKAVTEYPKYAAAWHELGRAQLILNQPIEAQKSFESAIAADPKLISPYLELSLLALKARDWQRTVDVTNRVIKLDPVDFPVAFFYNAVAQFNVQNVEAAEKSALEAQKLDTRHQNPQIAKLLEAINAAKKPSAAAVKPEAQP